MWLCVKMRRVLAVGVATLWLCALAALLLSPANAQSAETASGDAKAVLSLYREFAAAQNARDPLAVRRTFLDSPLFLWVSDGMAVWGPHAVIDRMQLFQQSEIWRVEPDLSKAEVVQLTAGSAMLHVPLSLYISSKAAGLDRLRFLVEVICVQTSVGWRIAALLTTTDKSSG